MSLKRENITDNSTEENSSNTNQHNKKHFWKKEEEELLRDWADKAQCYQWLHLQAHDKFRKKKYVVYYSCNYYIYYNRNC